LICEEPPPVNPLHRRLHTAGNYFAMGRFARCELLCRELIAEGLRSSELTALLGETLLLRNQTAEAEPLLRQAVAEQGGSPKIRAALAECLRRSGQLGEAARLYRRLGREGFARKLNRLAETGWYLLEGETAADLPWPTDLPLVTVAVNGREGRFLVDTGVGETLIDPSLARSAQVHPLGVEPIHFPAGPAGQVEHAIVDELALGGLKARQIPVQVHTTRAAFANLLPLPVDGILGTGLLSRIPSTLDYRGRRLRMGASQQLTDGVPFFFAGDQYPLVNARINDRQDTLLFLDTGMIGAAVSLPFSTAEDAEVEIAGHLEGAGFGIASEMQARPFLCRSLEAVGVKRDDLPGMLIGLFRLEQQLGFHIGGLLGHDFVSAGALTLDFAAMRVSLRL
jgi:hypothetical protein